MSISPGKGQLVTPPERGTVPVLLHRPTRFLFMTSQPIHPRRVAAHIPSAALLTLGPPPTRAEG